MLRRYWSRSRQRCVANRLNGGVGNDTLTGGGSIDPFIFNTNQEFQPEDVGIDEITDFSQTQGDIILLDCQTFTAIKSESGTGFSIVEEFATVTSNQDAATSDAFIVYNSNNANLFYNPALLRGGMNLYRKGKSHLLFPLSLKL